MDLVVAPPSWFWGNMARLALAAVAYALFVRCVRSAPILEVLFFRWFLVVGALVFLAAALGVRFIPGLADTQWRVVAASIWALALALARARFPVLPRRVPGWCSRWLR